MPIEIEKCSEFNPLTVPTINCLVTQINDHDKKLVESENQKELSGIDLNL